MAVCRECTSLLRQCGRARPLRFATLNARIWTGRSFASSSIAVIQRRNQGRPQNQPSILQLCKRLSTTTTQPASAPEHPATLDFDALHYRVSELAKSATKSTDQVVPSEQRLLYVLEQLSRIAMAVESAAGSSSPSLATSSEPSASSSSRQKREGRESTATSALLSSVNTRKATASVSKEDLLNFITQEAEDIMRHPNVFITPAVLKDYVMLQVFLRRPDTIPDIFELYAAKATPKETKYGDVEYTAVNPDKAKAAVDEDTANTAIDAAIEAHNLPLCIDMVETTFCTPAWKKSKAIRRLSVPAVIAACLPFGAWALAVQYSLWQRGNDPSAMVGGAFACIMTYIGAVSMLGYISITTANDQMDRIQWAKGTPLWERWIREEERAAFDRIAGNWGFKDIYKRGDEEGEEWDGLREYLGVRSMSLDRTELLEGME